MTAKRVAELLATKHINDFFVTECKDGPTWSGTHLRMDAWAMKRSWANPTFTAYEIKMTRADFVSDDKWPGYLKYCNLFNFVCPKDVIKPGDLDKRVGLIYVMGDRLVVKKRPTHRTCSIPQELFMYLLMCRTRVVGPREYSRDQREEWKQWMEQKIEDRRLGRIVGRKIGETMRMRISEVNRENERLKGENNKYAQVAEFCKELGISLWNYGWRDQIKERMKLDSVFDPADINLLIHARSALQHLINAATPPIVGDASKPSEGA